MDHPSMNPHLHITNDTMEPPLIDRDTNYIYSAWGPYKNSIDNMVGFVASHYIDGYKSICEDVNEGRWIIFKSTKTACIAQGPFTFDIDHTVINDDGWIIGIRLGQDNWFIETRGLQGKSCFDFFGQGKFWVISMLRDLDKGQSFCAPPSIPFNCDVVGVEASIDPTLDPHIPKVKGYVSQALVEEHVDTRLLETNTLCEGEPDERILEPQSNHLVDFIGDGTTLGATRGSEGLSSLTTDTCLGIGHGDQISKPEQDGAHLRDEESQTLGPLPNDLNFSHIDELFAMFRDLESSQASHFELEGQQTVEETIVSTPNLGDNNEPTRKRPWMGEPPCSSLVDHNGMMEATRIFEPTIGEAWTMSKEAPVAKPSSPQIVLRLNALRGATNSNEVNSLGMGSNGNEDMASSMHGVLMETQEGNALHPLLDQRPPSSTKYQSVNPLGNVEDISKDAEVEGHMVEGMGSNGNEDMAFFKLGVLMETKEGNALHPLLDQGPSSSTKYQSVNHVGHIEDVSKDGEIEGPMVEGTMATMSTSSPRCKSSKRRPRQSGFKPKFKHHGVKPREGGRESFVAYFRPKDLPDSDKRFLTIGEFTDEAHAWYAYNLFAFVHEGEESCINMEDKESIGEDARFWREKPRVDLVSHLRLKGRGYFRSNVLPSHPLIQRYRNIKFRKNAQGIHKGKIRWFCDIHLAKGVTDPNVGNGTKETSTYETAEAAAKEADRLLMLNEGLMAWTNFSILNYMKDAEKNLWNPTWIPLQDNPKKYLSTATYNSQFL